MGLPSFILKDNQDVCAWRATLLSRGYEIGLASPPPEFNPLAVTESGVERHPHTAYIIKTPDAEISVIEALPHMIEGERRLGRLVFLPPKPDMKSRLLQRKIIGELIEAGLTGEQ
jgi:hypothetical protein